MTDFTSAAEALYGQPEQAPAAPAPQPAAPAPETAPEPTPVHTEDTQPANTETPEPEEQAAPANIVEAIKKAIPDEIQAQRDADEARKLYSPQVALAKAIPDNLFANVEGMDEATQSAVVTELRELAGDVGFTAEDITTVTAAMSNPPQTEEERIASREKAVQLLNEHFGQGAKQAWLDARAYVAADARRAAILQRAGDDPRVVLRVAQLARQAKTNRKR